MKKYIHPTLSDNRLNYNYIKNQELQQQVCIPCVGDFEYGIMICNANAVLDDNFDIFLNDTKIGEHIAPDDQYAGEFFITNSLITSALLNCENCEICSNDPDGTWNDFPQELCQVCANSTDITKITIDKNLFITGSNNITMTNTQNNGYGNYGRVWVFKFSSDPIALVNIVLSDEYADESGISFGPYNFTI